MKPTTSTGADGGALAMTFMRRTLTLDGSSNSPTKAESGPEDSSTTDLTELLLSTRRDYLKKRQPRSPYVRTLLRKLRSGVARPFDMLLAVGESDIDDGAPGALVLAPWYAGIGRIRVAIARRDARKGIPWVSRMNAAMLRETRATSRLNEAQLRAAGNMEDMAALMALRIALREYKAIYEEMEVLIDERCAVDRLVA